MSDPAMTKPERDTARRLALYDEILDSLASKLDELPSGQIADRYHRSLTSALALMAGERKAMVALFAAALADDAPFDLLRGERAARLTRAYHRLVQRSDDALREPKALELGIALHTFHMLIVLFWLYDRSPKQESTGKLLNLTRDLFKLLRPMFFLPMVPQGIAKLAEIVSPELKRESERATAQEDPRDSEHQDFNIHRD
ncbi:MAG: hypothetical protein OXI77_03725 [Chloroflexota bacterium]|nr:hypothetical protein [Chloroflexota bacterium]MDE2907674.1 hypothetical protein [Chloroflexota bacterium]